MTVPSSPRPGDALRALRERFRASSAETLAAFRALARRLAAAPGDDAVVEELRAEVHRVRGTAGSYGFVDASRLAARLEERVVQWSADRALDADGRATIVEHFVGALTLAFEAREAAGETLPRRRLLVLGGDAERTAPLRAEAPLHGFELRLLPPSEATPEAVRAVAPHLVVADGDSLEVARDAALAVSAPLVVLADDVAAARRALERGPGPTAGALAAAAEPSAVFELAARLALRGSYRAGTVLLVDDDPLVLALVRYVIETPGTRVVTLPAEGEIVARVEAVAPALLLMDVRLARASGLELTRRIRAHPGLRELPIILLSADAGEAMRRDVYEAGADEFIGKPIVAPELRRRIADRLGRHRSRRLAEGLDPRSGLPMAERMRRETAELVAFLRREGMPGAVAAIRPDGAGEEPVEDAWLDEAVRIMRALVGGGAVGGLDDDGTLVVALGADAAAAAARLERLSRARPADAPPWRAGVAAVEGAGEDAESLRCGAHAALAEAAGSGAAVWTTDGRGTIRRWS